LETLSQNSKLGLVWVTRTAPPFKEEAAVYVFKLSTGAR